MSPYTRIAYPLQDPRFPEVLRLGDRWCRGIARLWVPFRPGARDNPSCHSIDFKKGAKSRRLLLLFNDLKRRKPPETQTTGFLGPIQPPGVPFRHHLPRLLADPRTCDLRHLPCSTMGDNTPPQGHFLHRSLRPQHNPLKSLFFQENDTKANKSHT